MGVCLSLASWTTLCACESAVSAPGLRPTPSSRQREPNDRGCAASDSSHCPCFYSSTIQTLFFLSFPLIYLYLRDCICIVEQRFRAHFRDRPYRWESDRARERDRERERERVRVRERERERERQFIAADLGLSKENKLLLFILAQRCSLTGHHTNTYRPCRCQHTHTHTPTHTHTHTLWMDLRGSKTTSAALQSGKWPGHQATPQRAQRPEVFLAEANDCSSKMSPLWIEVEVFGFSRPVQLIDTESEGCTCSVCSWYTVFYRSGRSKVCLNLKQHCVTFFFFFNLNTTQWQNHLFLRNITSVRGQGRSNT